MTTSGMLTRAMEMMRDSRNAEAEALIRGFIDRYPKDPAAWALLARVVEGRDEKLEALQVVLQLKPEDEWAREYVSQLMDTEVLQRAFNLAKEGRQSEAAYLVNQLLEGNPRNANAWMLKARLSKKKEETIYALREVLKLSPDNQQAKDYLHRIQSQNRPITGPQETLKKTTSWSLILGLVGLAVILGGLCLAFTLPLLGVDLPGFTAAATDDLTGVSETTNCQELIQKALQVSNDGCSRINSNEICYGNYNINAELIPDVPAQFLQVGDVINIGDLTNLRASPLDLDNNLWGVAVLKLQANLPGTLPGQNVTFLVYGDTTINNASGDMSAFYFSTGLTGIKCDAVPFDGLMINMPDGTGIQFQANGVDFLVEGDAVLTANAGGEMGVTMLNGTAHVTANGVTQELSPGTMLTVPLSQDYLPSGPPSDPVSLSEEEVLLGCQLTGQGCPPAMETQLAVYGGIGFGGPTNTLDPSVPTSTPVPVDPSIPTNTPVPVPPGQPTNTSVPLSTNTSAPPATNTPFGAPTATKTPVPSNTVPGAPTATKTLVPTNTPVPTNTNPPPPTNTPAPVCGSITLTGGSGGVFTITNNNFSGVYLEEITLTWDVTANGNWKGTKLEDKNIPTGNNTKSPHTITMSGQPKNFLVEGGNTESLVFEFQNDPPAAGPYSVTIKFSFGSCSKSASAP